MQSPKSTRTNESIDIEAPTAYMPAFVLKRAVRVLPFCIVSYLFRKCRKCKINGAIKLHFIKFSYVVPPPSRDHFRGTLRQSNN